MTQGPETEGGSGAERLSALLDRQISLYHDLEAMGDRQAQAIEDGDTDELLRILSARQRLITRIGELVGETRPMFGDAASTRDEAVVRRLNELDEVVGRIAKADERDRAALASSRGVVSSQLNVVATGKRAVTAYGSRPGVAPACQDRRG